MSFFSLMFPTVREEDLERRQESPKGMSAEAVAEEGALEAAAVAAIAAALEANFACGSQELKINRNAGAFNPWCMKFYGLRTEFGLRNPWLEGRKNYGGWSKRH